MQKISIYHATTYQFSEAVELKPHRLHLRPRDGHDVRICRSTLSITPAAELLWFRDELDNSVAIATFSTRTETLEIISRLEVEQYQLRSNYNEASIPTLPHPITYTQAEKSALQAYFANASQDGGTLKTWLLQHGFLESSLAMADLPQLCSTIGLKVHYQARAEQGVQSASETIQLASGSCRDLAWLFVCASRQLGFAARFVSGYLINSQNRPDIGATHAWAEVYLPEYGWTGFDPTTKSATSGKHIAVASTLVPDAISAVSGSYLAGPDVSSSMHVTVKVALIE